MRTRNTVALATATAVTAGVLVGYAVERRDSGSGDGARGPVTASATPLPTPAATRARAAILAELGRPGRTATAAGVSRALAAAAKSPNLGKRFGGLVVSAQNGDVLWSRDPSIGLPPASTTKLFTAAAALTALGPQTRLTTATARRGSSVYLVGGGDVTLTQLTPKLSADATGYPTVASLQTLAGDTANALAGQHRVAIVVDRSAWAKPGFAPGWPKDSSTSGDVAPPSPLEVDEGRFNPRDYYSERYPDAALAAGAAFANALRHRGIHITRINEGHKPSTATPLAAVRSPTIAQLVQRMLTNSDNDLAEALGRAVALKDGEPANFAGAAAAVTERASRLGVDAAMSLQDTSGLSKQDRIAPEALVQILQAIVSTAPLHVILAGLPVAGFTGTLGDRYDDATSRAGAGVVHAKTGTLSQVNALAGAVVDRNGEQLLFAFMASKDPGSGYAEPALDRLAARIAGCGC